MSNLLKHAEVEFEAAKYNDGDTMNRVMKNDVMELLTVFSNQGHSGFSASFCLQLFTKLARFEPLIPLTGKDSEWVECAPGMRQNVRCSRVFKDENGKAYDIDAVVFIDANGEYYTNGNSRRYVEFPYTPTTTYVKDTVAEGAGE